MAEKQKPTRFFGELASSEARGWDHVADGYFKFIERLLLVGALKYASNLLPPEGSLPGAVLSGLAHGTTLAFGLWLTWSLLRVIAPLVDKIRFSRPFNSKSAAHWAYLVLVVLLVVGVNLATNRTLNPMIAMLAKSGPQG